MPTSKKNRTQQERWVQLEAEMRANFPQGSKVWLATEDFIELRFKAREDGTVLGILKTYGPDGGPLVCFGVGYDVNLAFMALEATVAGGFWKIDKPWGQNTESK